MGEPSVCEHNSIACPECDGVVDDDDQRMNEREPGESGGPAERIEVP